MTPPEERAEKILIMIGYAPMDLLTGEPHINLNSIAAQIREAQEESFATAREKAAGIADEFKFAMFDGRIVPQGFVATKIRDRIREMRPEDEPRRTGEMSEVEGNTQCCDGSKHDHSSSPPSRECLEKWLSEVKAERDQLKAEVEEKLGALLEWKADFESVKQDRDAWKDKAERLADTVQAMRDCGSNDCCDYCLEISKSAFAEFEKRTE